MDIAILTNRSSDEALALVAALIDLGHDLHILIQSELTNADLDTMRREYDRIVGADLALMVGRFITPGMVFGAGVAVGAMTPLVAVLQGDEADDTAPCAPAVRFASRSVPDAASALELVARYHRFLLGQSDSDVNPLLSTGATHEC